MNWFWLKKTNRDFRQNDEKKAPPKKLPHGIFLGWRAGLPETKAAIQIGIFEKSLLF